MTKIWSKYEKMSKAEISIFALSALYATRITIDATRVTTDATRLESARPASCLCLSCELNFKWA